MEVGYSQTQIHCFIPGIGMMGYGQPHNIVKEQATPLWTRTVIFKDKNDEYFIFINMELALVSIAVKEEVTRKLQAHFPDWNLNLAKIMITSQHTHSAPGGYSHYPFYNFTVPGFRPTIFKAVVESAVESVKEASKRILPSALKLGNYKIPAEKEVAFNRSIKAYLNNPEVAKISTEESHLAIDREMIGLNIFDLQGNLRVHLNWFGVHATSISSFNQRIHHDNKGVAAQIFEKKHPGSMAIFAQSAAGDISPNFRWDKKLKRMIGKFSDQYENAAFNGELQADAAQMITPATNIEGSISCFHLYHDIASIAAAPAHGVAFFEGTLEGPGIPKPLGSILKFLSRGMKYSKIIFSQTGHKAFYEAHGHKDILLDHRSGEFIGIPLSLWKKMPNIHDPVIGSFIRHAKNNSINTTPWVPPVLPYQIIQLGELILVGVPGEITTVAATRLKKALEVKFPSKNIIISSYANAYMGYVTTAEEYDLQCYEGGHTIYGRNTLAAMIKGFEDLAEIGLTQRMTTETVHSFHYPTEELARRTIE